MRKWLFMFMCLIIFAGCSIFQKQKYGCPTNGKNIGAERVLSGDKAAMKSAKKAGKFKN